MNAVFFRNGRPAGSSEPVAWATSSTDAKPEEVADTMNRSGMTTMFHSGNREPPQQHAGVGGGADGEDQNR